MSQGFKGQGNTAGKDGRQKHLLPVGNQQENGLAGWLFQGFQQRIGRRGIKQVGIIDNDDLEPAA